MHALPVMIAVLCVMAIAYRYYSAFLAAKVAVLDDSRVTPAHRLNDGQNYHPTHKWVLFGHHFAAISGAGPLVGPVLAAQFGYLPGLIWLVVGVVLAGATQDFLVLAFSVRRNGRSLAELARTEIGPVAGTTTAIAILFIIVNALAGLGLVVVKALGGEVFKRADGSVTTIPGSSWGIFTIACSIPIALFVGLWMYRIRKGHVVEASIIGAAAVLFCTWLGHLVPGSWLAPYLSLSQHGVTISIAVYGFIASVLPIWLLLCPRDYLSSFLKIGTLAALVIGTLIVNPVLKMPALTTFTAGGGPIIPGKVFPFVFITVMCGAISGFHALVSSGTTPKMLSLESHARPIGYGAMLIEGLVGVVALIAACSLAPGDYFAINVDLANQAKFAPQLQAQGFHVEHLHDFEGLVGEDLQGRSGGAVSLAVGMSQIFSGIPFFGALVSFWYHFAIMFEALFILTTIDTGTRVARFLVQEMMGRFHPKLGRPDWLPGAVISTALVVLGWSYFIWTGSIDTIWPMFGISNQLLAVVALAVVSTVLVNAGRARYLWTTVTPMLFVSTTTMTAGYQLIFGRFRALAQSPNAALAFKGTLNIVLTLIMMACVVVVLADAARRWIAVWRGTAKAVPELGPAPCDPNQPPERCC
ncbi:MAG: carbon starvation protein A [Planctomycetes bacterium]|nr:carbon starvation protein A [Planctomycetota bacterium]